MLSPFSWNLSINCHKLPHACLKHLKGLLSYARVVKHLRYLSQHCHRPARSSRAGAIWETFPLIKERTNPLCYFLFLDTLVNQFPDACLKPWKGLLILPELSSAFDACHRPVKSSAYPLSALNCFLNDVSTSWWKKLKTRAFLVSFF